MPTMHSQNRNTLTLWLSLSCAALLVACGGGGSHKDARVRLLNASADLSSADLFVENGKLASSIAARSVSAYADRGPGGLSLQIRSSGDGATVASSPATLKDQTHYTVIAYGRTGAIRTSLLQEDQEAPPSGQSKLMVLNLAPEAGALDVFVTAADASLAGATPFATNLAGGAGSGYLTRNSGSFRVRVTGTGRTDDLRLDLADLKLDSGAVTTLVLTGGSGGVLVHGLTLAQRGEAVRRDNPMARVRLVAAMAGGRVDGSIGERKLLDAAAAPVIGDYTQVPAAASALRTSLDGQETVRTLPAMTAGGDYTLLLRGPASSATLDVLTDENRPPAQAGQARLRLVNGLAQPVSLNFNYSPLAGAISPGAAGGGTVTATTSALLTVTATQSAAALHTEPSFAALADGVYTVFMLGGDGTARGVVRRER